MGYKKVGHNVSPPIFQSIVRKLTVILESDDASFDEPVRETIMRDLREVAHKFRHVIAPQKEVGTFSSIQVSVIIGDTRSDCYGCIVVCCTLIVYTLI